MKRRIISLTRTVLPNGIHVLDAIDDQGHAWELIYGNPDRAQKWTKQVPLPEQHP